MIKPNPPLEDAFRKVSVRKLATTAALNPDNLGNPRAWDQQGRTPSPSPLLRMAVASLILDGAVRGNMLSEGTLLVATDTALDAMLAKLPTESALGTIDCQGARIDWESEDSVRISLQKWSDEMNQMGAASGKRAGRESNSAPSSSSPRQGEQTDEMAMEDLQEGPPVSDLDGSPVFVPPQEVPAKKHAK